MTAETRGGRGKCRACNHPDQDAINDGLVRGVSLRKLGAQYGISFSALRDHKQNHLSPALVAVTKEARLEGSARSIVGELDDLRDQAHRILAACRASGNAQQALGAIRTLTDLAELRARITGELDARPQVTVNLMQSREWIQVQTVVMEFVEERLSERDAAELGRRLLVLDGGQA